MGCEKIFMTLRGKSQDDAGSLNGPSLGNSTKRPQSKENLQEFALSLLDRTNKQIITMLEADPFTSQVEIAKKLGLSQSSIALRLDRLRKSGVLMDTSGVHLKMLGLEMCRADVNCTDGRSVLEWAKSCPLMVNGSIGVGGQNVSLYFTSEDMEMFQFIVDEHIRRLEGVSALHFSPIVAWAKDFVAPVKLEVPRSDEPPCSMLPYCPRCPANPNYDGRVFNGKTDK